MGLSFGTIESPDVVVRALNGIYGGDKFNRSFVDWLNAAPRGWNRWYALFDGGDPVAVYGLLPLAVRYRSKVRRGALCNNVGVAPKYRGRGLFVDIGRRALEAEGADIVLGVPNDAAVPGHRTVGWQTVGRLELLRGYMGVHPGRGDAEHRRFEDFDFGMADVESNLCVVRNEEWRWWRYSKPGEDYRQSVFSDGCCVWKERVLEPNGEFPKMAIATQQVLEASNDSVPFMVLSSTKLIDMLAMRGTRRHEYLKLLGFKPVFGRDLIVYPSKGSDLGSVRFDLCDYDVF